MMKHSAASDTRKNAQRPQDSISHLSLGAALFVCMFVLAFVLPERVDDSLANEAINWAHNYTPNLRLLAEKSATPILVEIYLVTGLLMTAVALIAFMLIWPRESARPVESRVGKWMALAMFGSMALVASALLWNPAASEFEVGPLAGRWGGLMHIGLSSRMGMSLILNLFFFVGPYFLLSIMWMGVSAPVRTDSRDAQVH